MSEKRRRSRLEIKFETILKNIEADYVYEETKLPYTIPESQHTYLVDWTIGKILCETKGYLSDYQERNKYALIKQQYPDLDLRFVFDNPNKLCGGTKMTHAKWAEKLGFKWCGVNDLDIITEWFKENNVNPSSDS